MCFFNQIIRSLRVSPPPPWKLLVRAWCAFVCKSRITHMLKPTQSLFKCYGLVWIKQKNGIVLIDLQTRNLCSQTPERKMALWIPLPISCLPFEAEKWTNNFNIGRYFELSLCNRRLCFMSSDWISICIKGSGFSVVLGFLLFIDSGDYRGFDRWSLQHRVLT